jgi:hypothetical protein
MPAPTLDGKLLCANSVAFDVVIDQAPVTLDPTDIYVAGAGFLRPPTGFLGGPLAIDSCLVGEIEEGFVIVFRGTLHLDLHQVPTLVDWLNDFQAIPIPVSGFPGAVHEGFYNAWNVLMPGIITELKKQMAASTPGRPVIVTGYSKGGGVAPLAAWGLKQAGITPSKVVTFAGAKAANEVFSAAYNNQFTDHTRYEYDFDIVPHVPLSDGGFLEILSKIPVIGDKYKNLLSDFDYQPVGTLAYIQSNHQIVPDDPTLRGRRDLELALEVLHGHFSLIASEHSISCGAGYMTAIAPTGVCP